MIFEQEDVLLLLSAARAIKGRKPVAAYKLAALANRAFPDSPGIKEKMEEYRQRSEQPPKSQFIVTYHVDRNALDSDKFKSLQAEFQQWVTSLDVPEGSPLVSLTTSNTVRPDGTVLDDKSSSRLGFSLFRAESMGEALSQAKRCPFLELGMTLEVSEIGPLPTN